MLIDLIKAIGMIVGAFGAILIAPLIFIYVFSLISGFNEHLPEEQ